MTQFVSSQSRRMASLAVSAVACWLALSSVAQKAWSIPTFSRKYRTSCVTCHTVFPKLNKVGEAFRRNGYQFPSDDELLVKEEPVPLGSDAYKDMFPNSVWPSDLPSVPPLFIRGQFRFLDHLDPGEDGRTWDMDFPHELELGGAGTFGKDIAAFFEITFAPAEEEIGVERTFMVFSNLFAPSDEDDENGMRTGNRWLVLPKHALNLRIGKLEPQVIPHVASEHARIPTQEPLPNFQTIGQNAFSFETAQNAIEANGIIRQYWSYAVGVANGGGAEHLDNNNAKDVYFRIARKWWGYPLDGEIGSAEAGDEDNPKAVARAQSPDDEGDKGEEGEESGVGALDFWRDNSLETGFFGWWGKSQLEDLDFGDDFHRIGFDTRFQVQDLDLYGVFMWGHDEFAGLPTPPISEDLFSWFMEADYTFKPWILGFFRYESNHFERAARADEEVGRAIPGLVFLIRQNVKFQTELNLDTRGNDTGDAAATDELRFQLDFAY